MQFPNARILIFAKEPQPGEAKTRLIPRLGAQGACDFHAQCVRNALARRTRAQLAPVVLCAAPQAHRPFFKALAREYRLQLVDQQGEDLGQRMFNAARESLVHAEAVLLTGTDAPAMRNEHLKQALEHLYQGADVVMQAAADGGYVMLGMRSELPGLFTDMPWGSDQVAQLTRLRCRQLGKKLLELPESWDIDLPEDYDRLVGEGGLSTFRD